MDHVIGGLPLVEAPEECFSLEVIAVFILLAQFEMLVMLYLHEDQLQVLQFMTECLCSFQWGVMVAHSRAGTEMGREWLASC